MDSIKENDFLKKHRTEWQDFLWERFLDQLSGVKSAKERRAISALFSKHEQRIITQRLAILILLKEGRGLREISRLLFVSKNTVTAARKNFFGNRGVYRSQRDLPINKKIKVRTVFKTKKCWLDILLPDIDLWEIIKNPPRPSGIGIKGSLSQRVGTGKR